MKIFKAFNGAMQTTTCPVKITTGTSAKTLMQLSPPANTSILICEWGISFDGAGAACQAAGFSSWQFGTDYQDLGALEHLNPTPPIGGCIMVGQAVGRSLTY